MNANCAWPPEQPRSLDLVNAADRRHLVTDVELVEELVDRYRFHVPNEQPQCEARLIETVGRTHTVAISDIARARERVADRGLDLPVNVPVAVLFIWSVIVVTRRIERRFSDEMLPTMITLAIASIALSVLFVLIGEFWTSVLQMARVGSQHVGGRVARLPWKRHEAEILALAIVMFWTVVLGRRAYDRRVAIAAESKSV